MEKKRTKGMVNKRRILVLYLMIGLFALGLVFVCFYQFQRQREEQMKQTISFLYEQNPEWARVTLNAILSASETNKENIQKRSFEEALSRSGYEEEAFQKTIIQDNMPLYRSLTGLVIFIFISIAFLWWKYQRSIHKGYQQLYLSMREAIKAMKEQKGMESREEMLRAYQKEEYAEIVGWMGCAAAEMLQIYGQLLEHQTKLRVRMQSFTENIAHQIKTPLARISLSLELLEESNRAEKVEQCLSEVDCVKPLVEGLLNVARLEAGKVTMLKQPLDLPMLLQDAVHKVKAWEDYQWDFQGKTEELIIYGDEVWLLQAFFNLYENAASKTPEAGHISTAVIVEPGGALVEIADQGGGIPEEYLEVLFDRFSSSGNQEMTRTGIGLNLAKEIIEKHHGTIGVHNIGQGAVFSVFLPMFKLKNREF